LNSAFLNISYEDYWVDLLESLEYKEIASKVLQNGDHDLHVKDKVFLSPTEN